MSPPPVVAIVVAELRDAAVGRELRRFLDQVEPEVFTVAGVCVRGELAAREKKRTAPAALVTNHPEALSKLTAAADLVVTSGVDLPTIRGHFAGPIVSADDAFFRDSHSAAAAIAEAAGKVPRRRNPRRSSRNTSRFRRQEPRRNQAARQLEPTIPAAIPGSPERPVEADVVLPFTAKYLPWLRESLESIRGQHLVDRLIIHLIGDGCDVPAEFRRLDGVRCYRNATNVGPYVSACRVFNHLETPFLAIQDADDVSLPHRINRAVHRLHATGAAMYGAAMQQFCDAASPSPAAADYRRRKPFIFSGRTLINATRVVRVDTFEALNGFAGWPASADNEFCERAAAAGVAIVVDNTIAGRRRLHSQSLTMAPATGRRSRFRLQLHERLASRRQLWKPGFDPRPFGCLDQERHSPETNRLA